jgi:hypothetical protein
MLMPSVEEVFKILSTDEKFIARVKTSLDNIMKDGKIDQYDTPELVFLITDAYNEMSNLHLAYGDLPVLIKMLYTFIIEKFNLIPEDKKADFERLVDVAIKLVMLQPRVEQQVSGCLKWFGCLKSNATKSVEAPVTKPAEVPVTKPVDTPIVKPAEDVTKPAEVPVTKPAEVPVTKPAEDVEVPVTKPTEVPVTKPAETTVDKPVEVAVTKPDINNKI